MNTHPEIGSTGNCPDPSALSAFNAGRLGDPEMEALAEHLGTCERCESTLRELLRRPADSFEAGLVWVCAEFSATSAGSGGRGAGLTASAEFPTDTVAHRTTGADPGPTPKTLGPYTLTETLGRGGMGVVYKAVHGVLRRTVALKTLHPGGATRADALARFRTEGEIVARLEHPNVVRLFDFNEFLGVPYLAMELVDGMTLARRLVAGPLAVREAAELVRTVARAVGYAHGRSVVHRDLKPSNVLIARDGTPKVSDFGLAKVLDDGRGTLTEPGAVMGTPSYMAPEQAAGRLDDVGPRTDVYALGAIFYEVLTGAPPFTAEYRQQILAMVQAGNVVPPSQLRKDLPADLEAVCLKCLASSPDDRYGSAEALAEELDRWLTGERTITRRPGFFRRHARRVSTRRVLVGTAIIAAASGLIAAVPPPWKPPPAADVKPVAEVQSKEVRTPDGTLLPFHIRYGDEKTKATADADGVITVNTWTRCLIEYAPGPGADAFEFRAEVRHLKADVDSPVGLYFAHRAFPGTHGETHLYGRMTYNDLRAPADVVAMAQRPPPLPQPPPTDNVAKMGLVVLAAGPQQPWSATVDVTSSPERFQPCGFRADCWRELRVRVDSAGATGTWNGQPVGTVSAEKFTAKFAEKLATLRTLRPDDALVTGVPGRYDPRGGIGLLLERGSASFRGVTVTPARKVD